MTATTCSTNAFYLCLQAEKKMLKEEKTAQKAL